MDRTWWAAATLAGTGLLAGCHILAGLDSIEANPFGSGGQATTTTTSGGAAGAGAAGGGGGGPTTGGAAGAGGDAGAGGSMMECTKARDCGMDECKTFTCDAGKCASEAKTDAPCNMGMGKCTAEGNCMPVPAGCTDGMPNGKETDVDCGGPDCAKCPNTKKCAMASDCVSAFCDASVTPAVCAPCAKHADCPGYCGFGEVCKSTKTPQGVSCPLVGAGLSQAEACATGFCVENVCCDAACDQPCDSCKAATPGSCTTSKKGTTPSPACADPYVCDGLSASCPTTCVTNVDCTMLGVCHFVAPLCLVKKCSTPFSDGTACCSVESGCGSTYCVDGVCCNGACNQMCESCKGANTVAMVDGTCSAIKAGTNPDLECSIGCCNGTAGDMCSGTCL
jgi:hypothetical protein